MNQDRRSEPYNFILSHTSALSPGSRALFLGKGHGKNAVLLAKIGVHVEVLDSNDKELLAVQNAASEANVFLITRHTRIEYWNLPHIYDAIILGELPLPSTKHTYLFEKILSTLSPHGERCGAKIHLKLSKVARNLITSSLCIHCFKIFLANYSKSARSL